MSDFVTYHRNPTRAEVKFGYGAAHYLEIEREKVTKENGNLKKWFLNKNDGLRYYR